MADLLPDDLVELGQVQDAQGLQGGIKVRPFSPDPVALLAIKSVWLSLRPHLAVNAAGVTRQADLREINTLAGGPLPLFVAFTAIGLWPFIWFMAFLMLGDGAKKRY